MIEGHGPRPLAPSYWNRHSTGRFCLFHWKAQNVFSRFLLRVGRYSLVTFFRSFFDTIQRILQFPTYSEIPVSLIARKPPLFPMSWSSCSSLMLELMERFMIEVQGSAACFKHRKSRFSTFTVQKRSLPHTLKNNCRYMVSCYYHNVTSSRFVWFYSQDHMIFPVSWTSFCLLFPYYRFSEFSEKPLPRSEVHAQASTRWLCMSNVAWAHQRGSCLLCAPSNSSFCLFHAWKLRSQCKNLVIKLMPKILLRLRSRIIGPFTRRCPYP